MGSTTYEWILDHEFAGKDPAEWKWPYEIPCWVFTHRQLPIVSGAPIEFTSADVAAVHEEMTAAAGGRNVWIVGGGDLAGQFADAGLLDEVIVSIAPVTLGGGAPLLPRRIELRLDELGRNGDFAVAGDVGRVPPSSRARRNGVRLPMSAGRGARGTGKEATRRQGSPPRRQPRRRGRLPPGGP